MTRLYYRLGIFNIEVESFSEEEEEEDFILQTNLQSLNSPRMSYAENVKRCKAVFVISTQSVQGYRELWYPQFPHFLYMTLTNYRAIL